jgi:hypothetical protein
MDREVVTSVKDDHRSVRAVQLGDGRAALDVPWVTGSRDDGLEGDVVGQQVEEVPTIGKAIEALLDDAKNRSSALKSSRSGIVVVTKRHLPFPNGGALEVAIIGYNNEPPLQAIYGILGVATVLVAFRWLLDTGLPRLDGMPPRRFDHHRTRT